MDSETDTWCKPECVASSIELGEKECGFVIKEYPWVMVCPEPGVAENKYFYDDQCSTIPKICNQVLVD